MKQRHGPDCCGCVHYLAGERGRRHYLSLTVRRRRQCDLKPSTPTWHIDRRPPTALHPECSFLPLVQRGNPIPHRRRQHFRTLPVITGKKLIQFVTLCRCIVDDPKPTGRFQYRSQKKLTVTLITLIIEHPSTGTHVSTHKQKITNRSKGTLCRHIEYDNTAIRHIVVGAQSKHDVITN